MGNKRERLTDERLEELKRICEAATGGLWAAQLIDEAAHEIWIEGSGFYCRRYPPHTYKPERLRELIANAEFIAAARTALPELIAEVERLRMEVAMANEAIEMDEMWCNRAKNVIAQLNNKIRSMEDTP